MTDQQLLEAYLAGNPDALAALVRAHIDMVYATARRHVGPTQADDITQAVFIMLMRKSASLRRRESVAGWLYRATVYCCANWARTEARRRRHEREANTMDAKAAMPTPDQHALREMLDTAMACLSETDREAVLLRHLEQKSLGQTASLLGISEEAARKRAGRGLERLRDYFLRQGFIGPEAALGATLGAQAAIRAPAALSTAVLASAKGAAIPASVAATVKLIAGMYGWTHAKLAAIAAAVLAFVTLLAAAPFLKNDQPPAAPPLAPSPVAVGTRIPVSPIPLPPLPAQPPPPQVIDVSADPAFKDLPYQHVTVNFDNAAPAQAARAFGDATGLTVVLDTAPLTQTDNQLPPLALHVTDVPLMHAVLQMSKLAHAYPSIFDATRLTMRAALEDTVNSQATVGRWSVAGPFAAEVAQIQTAASAPGGRGARGAGGAASTVIMQMAFFAEPTLPVLRFPDTLTVDEFTDDNGHQLAPAGPRGGGRAMGGMPRTQLSIPLTMPLPPGTRIVSFRGKANYTLAGPTVPIKTESLDTLTTAAAGPMNVEILPMVRTDPPPPAGTGPAAIASTPTLSTYHIQVRVHRGEMPPAQWDQMVAALPYVTMTFLNADGQKTRTAAGTRPVRENPDTLLINYTTASAPPELSRTSADWKRLEPHHLQLDLPTSVRTIDVPFKFTDLPLP